MPPTPQTPRISLAVLQAFIGVGGLAAGIGLVLDPTGRNLGMSPHWLAASPFQDYLIPGVVLLAVNGVGQLLGSLLSFKRAPRHPEVAMALGAFLMAWIATQLLSIGYRNWLQPLYFAFGAAELGLAAFLAARSTSRS